MEWVLVKHGKSLNLENTAVSEKKDNSYPWTAIPQISVSALVLGVC